MSLRFWGACLLLLHIPFCHAQNTDSLNLDFEEWVINDNPIKESYLIQTITDKSLDEIPRGQALAWRTPNLFSFQSPESFSGNYALGLYSSGSFNPRTYFALSTTETGNGCPVDFGSTPQFFDLNFPCIAWKTPISRVEGYMKKKGSDLSMTDTISILFEAAIQDTTSGELTIIGRGISRFLPNEDYQKFTVDIQYDIEVTAIDFIKLVFYHSNTELNGMPAFVEHVDNISFDLISSTPAVFEDEFADCFQLIPNPGSATKETRLVTTCVEKYQIAEMIMVDLQGRLIQYKTINNRNLLINTDGLSSGIYRIILQLKDGQFVNLPMVIQ